MKTYAAKSSALRAALKAFGGPLEGTNVSVDIVKDGEKFRPVFTVEHHGDADAQVVMDLGALGFEARLEDQGQTSDEIAAIDAEMDGLPEADVWVEDEEEASEAAGPVSQDEVFTSEADAVEAARKALAPLGCDDPVKDVHFIIDVAVDDDGPVGFSFTLNDVFTDEIPEAPTDPKDWIIDDDLDVAAMAEAAGTVAKDDPAPANTGKRAAAAAKALADAQAGNIPQVPAFSPSAQAANVKRCETIHEMAQAGDIDGLETLPIEGKAHSAEMARRYRDLCLVAAQANAAASSKQAVAK
jgi:hypothetical protein